MTANLTADLTVNTDFAQVEVDEQQVNLTRFSLLYPGEARLLSRGTRHLRLRAQRAGDIEHQTVTPSLFYSRRIGLNGGRVIPIDVGGRLTGKVGSYGVGAMNIETRDDDVSRTPRTNFTVLRLKRDILRRSTIGAIVTNRSQSTVMPGASNLVVRRGRGVLVLPGRELRRLLGTLRHRRLPTRQRQLPGTVRLRRRPLRRAGAVPEGWRQLQSGGRLRPSRQLRGDRTARRASAPAEGAVQERSGSSRIRAASSTSRTAQGSWRRGSRRAGSPRSDRTATSSRWSHTPTTSCCSGRSWCRPGS